MPDHPDLSQSLLSRLGQGETINQLCDEQNWSRMDFDNWFESQCQSRVPSREHATNDSLRDNVTITRDAHGIPSIYAASASDMFFGFGVAMAQDRLFQMDFLRRRGLGQLSELLGASHLELDRTARVVGLHRIAEAQWHELSDDVQLALQRFADGVNHVVDDLGHLPPIEYSLLDTSPRPWTPIDSIACEVEFQWYLTGRFPIICIPELVRRAVGDTALYEQFICGEAEDESILSVGSYPPVPSSTSEPIGETFTPPNEGNGSNNWAVSGTRSASGVPMVASDPHIAIAANSSWYEARLKCPEYDVAGMAYVGMPALMFGRTPGVGWSITNNMCSLRDLYQETRSEDHPNCFLYNDDWIVESSRTETIQIRGEDDHVETVILSHNGPIVDTILPDAAQHTGPVALRWVGMYGGGWLTSLLAMNQATTVEQLHEAMRPWYVPSFCVVSGDTQGNIGLKATGKIPRRNRFNRHYRDGSDPSHRWQGYIPFDEMPELLNPECEWIRTANNRTAANDFPHMLSGCWSSGHRAARIREMLESQLEPFTFDDFVRMQNDVISGRAVECAPKLVNVLASVEDSHVQEARALLANWDGGMEVESVAGAIFNVFFTLWQTRVAQEHIPADQIDLIGPACGGIASRLIDRDQLGWFNDDNQRAAVIETFCQALQLLSERFGEDQQQWTWGQLHILTKTHVLAHIGDLGKLLNHEPTPVKGDMMTVGNTGQGPNWTSTSGAGYRLIHDLGSDPPCMWAVDGQGQSGHPGSPYYNDQQDDWLNSGYHRVPLDDAPDPSATRFTLSPD
ncbi:MAG: penicillin acylase family protein [Planctomycetaceae bacterium]|nr:penicillin acylase family protein [Planctomycetaceae bacterium]